MPMPRSLMLPRGDVAPDSPRLPVLIYRNALDYDDPDLATAFEVRFVANDWRPDWRGALSYEPHYHSNTHEVIGIAVGNATLRLGGSKGVRISVDASDALLLPAGTDHCCISSSPDFLAIGAYPGGAAWDVCKGKPTPEQQTRIATLPLPDRDPVTGLRHR